jgi:cysteine desulfurase
VAFHCDASQGLGYLPFDVRTMPIDLASLSAHKMYGPKGAGALYVRRFGPELAPLVPGGGQERGLRSGTLAVPNIVGFGRAAAIAREEGATEALRLASLRDRLRDGLTRLPATHLHGALDERHPGNLHLRFEAVTSEALLVALGEELAFSSGSACATVAPHPSHVLRAIGLDEEQARSGLRFGVGRFTTEAEIDRAIARVTEAVAAIRAKSSLWGRSP